MPRDRPCGSVVSTRQACCNVHRTRQPTATQRRTRALRLAEPLARHVIPADGIEVSVAPGTPRAETESRLAMALLAYVAAIVAVVTLLPFQFAVPSQPRVMLTAGSSTCSRT